MRKIEQPDLRVAVVLTWSDETIREFVKRYKAAAKRGPLPKSVACSSLHGRIADWILHEQAREDMTDAWVILSRRLGELGVR